MSGGALGVGLIAFAVLLPSLPTPSGSNFIEARLCASGRIIRIELPGQEEPDKQVPMPCHAVCARDNDSVVKGQKKGPKI
ncbi:MAG: hypothetical protein ACSHX3_09675 [Litorimonas sp.]